MIEHIRRYPGTIDPCACGKHPMHVTARGRSTADTMKFDVPAEAHYLECVPCSVRTSRFTTEQEAAQAWTSMHAAKPSAARAA